MMMMMMMGEVGGMCENWVVQLLYHDWKFAPKLSIDITNFLNRPLDDGDIMMMTMRKVMVMVMRMINHPADIVCEESLRLTNTTAMAWPFSGPAHTL